MGIFPWIVLKSSFFALKMVLEVSGLIRERRNCQTSLDLG